jgi:hypothetical protein
MLPSLPKPSRMRRGLFLAFAGLVFPTFLTAQGLVTSPRPPTRPVQPVAEQVPQVPLAAVLPDAQQTAAVGILRSLRPQAHPIPWPPGSGTETQAVPATQDAPPVADEPTLSDQTPKKKEKKSKKGSVCGDPSIKGEKLARLKSSVKGCGVEAPVRVTSIDGIRLSQPATIDCDTAIALKAWIRDGLRPAMGQREVVELSIAAHYICRPRNNVKGQKISEHGRGKAIDIAGFVFADGSSWTVANDYNRQIRKAHKAACGIFGTTLGPGSDGYHEDHLHFDTASYRSGPYCR